MLLSHRQIEQFHAQGWIHVKSLIDAPAVARLRGEVESLHEQMAAHTPPGVGVAWEDETPADRPRRIRQLMHSEKVSPAIESLLTSDTMLDVVEQLIGPRIILYHSKLMMKAARDGSFTPWHQDFGYWRYSSKVPSQVNCMLSIDPSTLANGCIRFVPGSHKAGLAELLPCPSMLRKA
jgi:ectoine hydroxylase-related dioxygenase (phytanoyl-CoA dioxygenase family)